MRVFYNKSFFRSFSKLDALEREAVKEAMDSFMASVEESLAISRGVGLKRLRRAYFEIRAGLALRVLFRREKDVMEWLFVGNHDEIGRFLKHM